MRDLHREGRRPSNGAAAIVDGALGPVEVPVTDPALPPAEPAAEPSRAEAVAPPRVGIDAEALSQRVAEILEPRVVQLVVARRDQWLAWMAGQFVEVAKLLDPITRIVVARILTMGALLAAVGLAGWTIYLVSGWERIGALGAVLGFLLPLAWRGQPKAPPEQGR